MNVFRLTTRFVVLTLAALALTLALPSRGLAQGSHAHANAKKPSGELVRIVRETTERYKDVAVAEAEGFGLLFGCVSGPDSGAMGLHWVNLPRVMDGVIDATQPEIVIYEPTANGSVRLIGADYLVLASAWDATHTSAPELDGQLFHYFEAPNRFGLPAFYTLHVWAWKESPTGTFVNWHSDVSCDAYSAPTP